MKVLLINLVTEKLRSYNEFCVERFLLTLQNALVVYMCEVMIDIIKHSFIAKFNDIKPIAFSEFLEDLCKQVYSK